jgi:hypothetical protein
VLLAESYKKISLPLVVVEVKSTRYPAFDALAEDDADAEEPVDPELDAGAVLHALSRLTSIEATAQRRGKATIVFRLARL